MRCYRNILPARLIKNLCTFDFVARYILLEAAAKASVEPMLSLSRDLSEKLGMKNAQSCKLIRFEDGHVDIVLLESIIQIFHHLSQTRLSGKSRHHLAHFALTPFVHSLFQIEKAGVTKVVVLDLAALNISGFVWLQSALAMVSFS